MKGTGEHGRGFSEEHQPNVEGFTGVLSSTLVAFLQAEGGSMVAVARSVRRQRAFAMRLATTRNTPQHGFIRGQTALGRRY